MLKCARSGDAASGQSLSVASDRPWERSRLAIMLGLDR